MPAGMRRDAGQLEARQRATVGHQLALALHHVQVEAGLVVGVGGEGLGGAAGDGGVAVDQLLDHPAHHLQAQRQRHHVQQHHVVAPAPGQQVGLDGRAQRHHLVGIDVRQRLAPEQLVPRSAAPAACGWRRRPGSPRRARPRVSPASCSARRTGGPVRDRAPAAPAPRSARRVSGPDQRCHRRCTGHRHHLALGQRLLGGAGGVQHPPGQDRVAAGVVRQPQLAPAGARRWPGRSRRRPAPSRRRWTSPRTRPPSSFRIEMSKVPPPRSNTAKVPSACLSRP